MSYVIAFANQKGGTGKTPLAVNTAAGIARRGIKTLLVDADPQGTAAEWFAKNPEAFEFDLVSPYVVARPVDEVIKETRDQYQVVLVDTPAGGGEGALDDKTTRRLVRQSALYIVPTRPTPGSLRSTLGFVARLRTIREYERLESSLSIMMLWTQAQSRTVVQRTLLDDAHFDGEGIYVGKTVLENRIGYDEADGWGTSIFGLDPKIKGNRVLQQEFHEYLDELEDVLEAAPASQDSIEDIAAEVQ